MKQRYLILAALVCLLGCASKVPLEGETKEQENLATARSQAVSRLSQQAKLPGGDQDSALLKEDKENVLSYFYKLYPKGSGKPISGLQFEDKAIENGYLKVTGYMEGYFIYDLFKGKSEDYLIEQSTGCGPECDQKFTVHVFKKGKLIKSRSLDNYYPRIRVQRHIAKMKSALPRGHTDEPLQSWIMLPKQGTTLEVLIVEQNPGATTGEVKVYKIGKLPWNGSSFDFQPLSPKTPSEIPIRDVQ